MSKRPDSTQPDDDIADEDVADEDTLEQIDLICDDFESEYRNPKRPDISSFLSRIDSCFRDELLLQLLKVDFHWRKIENDEQLDEYRRSFDSDVVILAFQEHRDSQSQGPDAESGQVRQGNHSSSQAVASQSSTNDGGQFKLIQEIGSGNFGAVWQAWDNQLKRNVAIKIPHPNHKAEWKKRIAVEAKAVGKLTHPNIVSIHQFDLESGWIVSELVEGKTLKSYLDEIRKDESRLIKVKDFVELFSKLSSAVHFAHCNNIVHRDIKPSNIMLTSEGEPKVLDFGLAKAEFQEESLTTEGEIVGSVAYMSPEQARGEKVDVASDVFSLGVVAYEMLTLRRPSTRIPVLNSRESDKEKSDAVENIAAKLAEITNDQPFRLSFPPGVPRDIQTIVRKCLEKNKFDRYATADGIRVDLERFRNKEPILAKRVGPVRRTKLWIARNPGKTASLIAVLLMIVMGLLAYNRYQVGMALESSERNKYFSQIKVIMQEWRDNSSDPQQLTEGLEACSPGYRNFEWHFLNRLVNTRSNSIPAGSGWVWDVELSPNKKWFLTGGGMTRDRNVKDFGEFTLWNADTREKVFTSDKLNNIVSCLSFHKDSRHFAAGCYDGSVTIWDSDNRTKIATLKSDFPVYSVRFSPIDDLLVCVSSQDLKNRVQIWDVSKMDDPQSLDMDLPDQPNSHLFCVCFSPDGKYMAISGHSILVWETESWRFKGELVNLPKGVNKLSDRRRINALAFSPDGTALVSGNHSGLVEFWDVSSLKRLLEIDAHESEIWNVGFSESGREILTSSWDRTAKSWDSKTGELHRSFYGHNDWVRDAIFMHGDQTILTCEDGGLIRLWSSNVDPHLTSISTRFASSDVLYDPDSETGVLLEEGKQERILLYKRDSQPRIIASTSGKFIAFDVVKGANSLITVSANGRIQTWNLESLKCVHEVEIEPESNAELLQEGKRSDEVTGLIIGQRYVFVSTEEHVHVFELTPIGLSAVKTLSVESVKAISISRDEKIVAISNTAGLTRFWDLKNFDVLSEHKKHNGRINDICFVDDANVVTVTADRKIDVWNIFSGESIGSGSTDEIGFRGHAREIMDVDVSPDGTRIVTCSNDRTVRLWDTRTGREVLVLGSHNSPVQFVQFFQDGNQVVSGSLDGDFRFWNGLPLK